MTDPVADTPDDRPSDGPERSLPDAAADAPRLPSSLGQNPSIVVPPPRSGPTEPDGPAPAGPCSVHDLVTGHGRFAPLRSDPPPMLLPTWWLRYSLFALLLGALMLTLLTEYAGEAGDVSKSLPVAAMHLGAGACLVVWSMLAMRNAESLVPATRYQSKSRGWLAATLWLLAYAAPVGVAVSHDALRTRLADDEDQVGVLLFVPVVFVAFILVWLPFRYCARHAGRIGAPHRTMIAWFWVTLVAIVGVLGIHALGLNEMLAEDGRTDLDRVIGLGVVYGLPMFVFAMATWQATTVFDEVIDLRWRRWKTEWEQTLDDFTAQPLPGPEASPLVVPLDP